MSTQLSTGYENLRIVLSAATGLRVVGRRVCGRIVRLVDANRSRRVNLVGLTAIDRFDAEVASQIRDERALSLAMQFKVVIDVSQVTVRSHSLTDLDKTEDEHGNKAEDHSPENPTEPVFQAAETEVARRAVGIFPEVRYAVADFRQKAVAFFVASRLLFPVIVEVRTQILDILSQTAVIVARAAFLRRGLLRSRLLRRGLLRRRTTRGRRGFHHTFLVLRRNRRERTETENEKRNNENKQNVFHNCIWPSLGHGLFRSSLI